MWQWKFTMFVEREWYCLRLKECCLNMWLNKIINNVNTTITNNQASKFISRSDNNFSLNLNKQWTHYLFGILKIHIPVHHPFELHLVSSCSWSWVPSSIYQAVPWWFCHYHLILLQFWLHFILCVLCLKLRVVFILCF